MIKRNSSGLTKRDLEEMASDAQRDADWADHCADLDAARGLDVREQRANNRAAYAQIREQRRAAWD